MGAVGALLEAGADPNVRDGQGQTILYLAEIGAPIFIAYEGGATPLHLAVSTGVVDIVKMLLEAGADPYGRNGLGQTVLHLAEIGSPIFKVLLASGADRNQVYANGDNWVAKIVVVLALTAVVLAFALAIIWDVTPLRLAVSWNAVRVEQTLLRTGTDPNRQNLGDATSLHLAVAKGHLDSVKVLLEAGANPNIQDGEGQTPLHLAEIGSSIFEVLLASRADPNIVYGNGATPLHRAGSKGDVGTVEALLKADADPNIQDAEGQMPLHLAELGSPIFHALLSAGAEPNIVYASGDTPLHVAVSDGMVDTVGALLEAGADPNIQDGEGQTPLHLAGLGSPTFNALLAAGADPDIAYTSGNAPLHVAVSEGLADIIRVLLEAGADPNIQDGEGQTPLQLAELGSPIFHALLVAGADPDIVYASGDALLHVAVSDRLVDTVGLLLEAGADPNIWDGQGRTPLYLAELGSPIFDALLAGGADPNIVYEDGATPLHLAVSERVVDVVGKLLDAKADPNAQDKDGNTPLHKAVRLDQNRILGIRIPRILRNQQVQFADLLVKGGANPCIRNNQGATPIDAAEVSSTKKWLREHSQGWC